MSTLTSDPMPVDLVMPYTTGTGDSDSFVQSDLLPVVVGVVCVLVIIIVVFAIACVVYKTKKKKGGW